MPLVALPVPLPPHTAELRVGDVDLDGCADLVAVSRVPAAAGPDGVVLTVVSFDAAGREAGRRTLDLGRRALLWDIEGGLFGVAAEGPVALEADGLRILAEAPTALAALGPTTPRAADVVTDLEDDGLPEVVSYGGGRLRVTSVDGTDRGSVPAPGRGELDAPDRSGTQAVRVAASWPALVVADLDGDGDKDLLLPEGRTLTAWLTGARVGATRRDLALPVDLDPRPEPRGGREQRREPGRSWFEDVDGDGKVDLVVQTWLLDGSWFGSRAEVALYRGTGTGFAAPAVVTTASAPVEVRTVDVDGDGDRDLLVPQVDTGLGDLARALVSRSVQVEARLHPLDGGTWAAEPVELRTLSVPIDAPEDVAVDLAADVDGDGRLDAVLLRRDGPLEVFAGQPDGIAEAALATAPVALPPGADPLLVADLTGDGRAEIVVWGPDQPAATLFRLP